MWELGAACAKSHALIDLLDDEYIRLALINHFSPESRAKYQKHADELKNILRELNFLSTTKINPSPAFREVEGLKNK